MYRTPSPQKTEILTYLQTELAKHHTKTEFQSPNQALWASEKPSFVILINLQKAKLKVILHDMDYRIIGKRIYPLSDPDCFQYAIDRIQRHITNQREEVRQK